MRARRNEDTAKNKNNREAAAATAMSQWATSRVQARYALLIQTNARTAKSVPITSKKSCWSVRQRRRKPLWLAGEVGAVAATDMQAV